MNNGFPCPSYATYISEPSPQTMIISTRTLRRKRQKTGDSATSESSRNSLTSSIPSTTRRFGQGGTQFLHAVMSNTNRRLSRGDQVALGFLRESPVYLASRLSQLNNTGENPVMLSVRFSNHSLAIELLLSISDVTLRRSILTHVSSDSHSNILHIAAGSGNVEFLLSFQLFWNEWGLFMGDVSILLVSLDVNGHTPKDVANLNRGNNHAAMIVILDQLEAFHLLGET
jgi:hypothetical protein